MKVQSGSWKQSDLLQEREREVELWDFFPNEKNKGRGVPCPEFSFLDFRRRERMRASTLWVWRCYSGDEAQAESTIIIQLSKWEERQELQASHYTEQQRAPSEMRCGYYTLLPPACQATHLQILLDWPAAAITTLELDKPHWKCQVKGAKAKSDSDIHWKEIRMVSKTQILPSSQISFMGSMSQTAYKTEVIISANVCRTANHLNSINP